MASLATVLLFDICIVISAQGLIGISSSDPWMFNNSGFAEFFSSDVTPTATNWFRMAEMYPNWTTPLLPDDAPAVQWLQSWLDGAEALAVEPLIVFTPDPMQGNPDASAYRQAFAAFVQRWPSVKYFLAWNEPNHPPGDHTSTVTAQTAVTYFLEAYTICKSKGCNVAAGNLLQWSPGDVTPFYMRDGPDKPCNDPASCSYMDQYKYYIDSLSGSYGFPHLRPQLWALHPWGDAFAYQMKSSHCSSTSDCAVRAFSASLQGSWATTSIWLTETGGMAAGQDVTFTPFLQACTAAFLQRLMALDSRITRLYWYDFEGGPVGLDSGVCPFGSHATGPCFFANNNTVVRPAFDVLRNRITEYDAACP
jgi:hypothetical protein